MGNRVLKTNNLKEVTRYTKGPKKDQRSMSDNMTYPIKLNQENNKNEEFSWKITKYRLKAFGCQKKF